MSLGLMMTIEWSWVVPRTRMSGASHLMVVVMVVAGIHTYIHVTIQIEARFTQGHRMACERMRVCGS